MLKIYNTLTRQKEFFKPRVANKVDLYVCGPTVYDYCHIGNGRTFAAFDVIVRYLKYCNYEVTYVRNITDIDDKIINRAHEKKQSIAEIVSFYIKAMHEDFAQLNLLQPDHEPKATDFIPQMIQLIERLISKQQAYIGANGDVYFDVRAFKAYGALSHHQIEQLESGARIEISEAKKDPLDFVLWKLAKPNEPQWDSPWGAGRPGWHIECSAMSISLLGETFDLHGGGFDLIFPHHENEIAQAEAATNQPFVRKWLHAGFLQINKEKMSKSLGNFSTIHDLLTEYSGEVLRFFLINSHYRSPLVYSSDALFQAKQALTRLYTAIRGMPEAEAPEDSDYEKNFKAAMDDDFNAPIAFSHLFTLAHEIQRLRGSNLAKAASLAALLKKLAQVFGLLETEAEIFFQSGEGIDIEKIRALITARNAARAQKNWAEADRIRQELTALSIIIEDTEFGTTWKKAK